ncbi:hypothetical protein GUJ93_ZPchr0003g17357 [Zizania palustris]|uniref:Uncharacterized protein n=1 Tax=Zizania palustris TaxID=103762 RepID=A0A8J5SJ81_ZIZPA|nr:hypothetical protein GUJ93_ZPchr0003g17357 [Zizania palustris]
MFFCRSFFGSVFYHQSDHDVCRLGNNPTQAAESTAWPAVRLPVATQVPRQEANFCKAGGPHEQHCSAERKSTRAAARNRHRAPRQGIPASSPTARNFFPFFGETSPWQQAR